MSIPPSADETCSRIGSTVYACHCCRVRYLLLGLLYFVDFFEDCEHISTSYDKHTCNKVGAAQTSGLNEAHTGYAAIQYELFSL